MSLTYDTRENERLTYVSSAFDTGKERCDTHTIR